MKYLYLTITLLCVTSLTAAAGIEDLDIERRPDTTNGTDRTSKFVSLFTVVRFANTMCTASSGYNGTCMTSAECTSGGGTGTGTCASGFGVCCVCKKKSCSSTSSRNCSYWQNPGGASTSYNQISQCSFKVKKFSSNILNQPDVNGVCSVDMFTVVSGASNPVPIICGSNTGQHMYLDMSPSTDTFELSIITTTANMSRYWNIKASQIACSDYTNLAPDQCLQYFQTTSGTIQSYNYQSVTISTASTSGTTTYQLANQDYAICIRMNAGFCGIAYAACPDTLNTNSAAFSLSGTQLFATANPTLVDSACTTDWLQIPCATNHRSTTPTQVSAPVTAPAACVSRVCGGVFSSYDTYNGAAATAPVPVYSYRKPFQLLYYTDSEETTNTDFNNLGFCLTYVQQPCTTTQSG